MSENSLKDKQFKDFMKQQQKQKDNDYLKRKAYENLLGKINLEETKRENQKVEKEKKRK